MSSDDVKTDFDAFLTRVVDDGIAAAREDYGDRVQRGHKNAPAMLKGAVAGFEACRGKSVEELRNLLADAGRRRLEAAAGEASNYWEVRCFESEVEWVCNVVSCALYNQGLPTFVSPTARGMLKAAEVLGVRA